MSILLAEDHAFVRQALVRILREVCSVKDVVQVGSGREVKEVLESRTFDILILDVRLPEGDGYDVCEYVVRNRIETKIIILTQYSSPEMILHFMRLGVFSFLVKSLNVEEIDWALQVVNRGDTYFPTVVIDQIKTRFNELSESSPLLLKEQEKVLVKMLASGLTSKEIASRMRLTVKTVSTYRERLLIKTKAKNVAELISFAYHNGLID